MWTLAVICTRLSCTCCFVSACVFAVSDQQGALFGRMHPAKNPAGLPATLAESESLLQHKPYNPNL